MASFRYLIISSLKIKQQSRGKFANDMEDVVIISQRSLSEEHSQRSSENMGAKGGTTKYAAMNI